MSLQKGNTARSRAQKHQNQKAFKNDLHDKSHKTKFINSIEVANVCERCKKIIEWKIKYKKYKPLKAPAKCTKCEQKSVRQAYHITCLPCAKQHGVCPKCNEKAEIVEAKPSREELLKTDAELQALLKKLPERKRRTFMRYMNQEAKKKSKSNSKDQSEDTDSLKSNEEDKDIDSEPVGRDDLLSKLKELVIKEGRDEFDFDITDDEEEEEDEDESN